MVELSLVYPHQLFESHPAIHPSREILLIEDPLLFTQFKFHKKKLLFHRLSMQRYAKQLASQGHNVQLFKGDAQALANELSRRQAKSVHLAYLADDWLETRLNNALAKNSISISWKDSPSFLLQKKDAKLFLGSRKRYSFLSFYKKMRLRTELLLEEDGRPKGGKWTYDTEHRKKWPKKTPCPAFPLTRDDHDSRKAQEKIAAEFHDHYGVFDHFFYPVDHNEARAYLKNFLNTHLENFGPYEDAIVSQDTPLHHSLLSPLLNSGLLTPQQVISETIEHAASRRVSLPSLEGFLRQLVGWREYIHALYVVRGRKMRSNNFWQHQRRLPKSFWEGTTSLLPVDNVIGKVIRHAYSHHIERLMIMTNIMVLCEIHPDDSYRWFMEMYIDAYDWVMVPNVYGMGLFADGGSITTKPYISSSNYLRRMSDFPKGDWAENWDSLYWRFIQKHKDFFASNPRLSMMTRHLQRMGKPALEKHIYRADIFLDQLYS